MQNNKRGVHKGAKLWLILTIYSICQSHPPKKALGSDWNWLSEAGALKCLAFGVHLPGFPSPWLNVSDLTGYNVQYSSGDLFQWRLRPFLKTPSPHPFYSIFSWMHTLSLSLFSPTTPLSLLLSPLLFSMEIEWNIVFPTCSLEDYSLPQCTSNTPSSFPASPVVTRYWHYTTMLFHVQRGFAPVTKNMVCI